MLACVFLPSHAHVHLHTMVSKHSELAMETLLCSHASEHVSICNTVPSEPPLAGLLISYKAGGLRHPAM